MWTHIIFDTLPQISDILKKFSRPWRLINTGFHVICDVRCVWSNRSHVLFASTFDFLFLITSNVFSHVCMYSNVALKVRFNYNLHAAAARFPSRTCKRIRYPRPKYELSCCLPRSITLAIYFWHSYYQLLHEAVRYEEDRKDLWYLSWNDLSLSREFSRAHE